MEVSHPALRQPTDVRYTPEYRERRVAQDRGLTYERFFELPREEKIDLVAEWETGWRVAALQHWEQQQDAERRAQAQAQKHKA